MAVQQKNEVGFTFIKLMKDEVLGSGSYGTVYKASCDDLVCAAKIMHHITVDQSTQKGRFENEYEFLTSLRHPNIVLFLGFSMDQDTNFPILLMELMDESLTWFLESGLEPLPFHIEVNICHDVAMALSFLHSNGIIHKNLSSNNVLMIGNVRAKITDFSMGKLWNTSTNQGTLSKHPSCSVYMPPEGDTNYSNKLDCFSFGVLSIQILTGHYPQPSDPFQVVEVKNQQLRVPERERRKCHLDLISSDHLILPLALNCIQDKEVNRPLSSAICARLLDIKKSSQYTETIFKASNKKNVLEDIDMLVREMQYFSIPSEGGSVSCSTSHVNSMECSETHGVEEQLPTIEKTVASEEIKELKGEPGLVQDQSKREEVHEKTVFISEKGESRLHTSTLENNVEASKSTSAEDEQMNLQLTVPLVTGAQFQNEPLQSASPSQEQEKQHYIAHREEICYLTGELERTSQQLKEKDQLLLASEQRYHELHQEMRVLEKKFAVRERANSYVPLSKVTLKWKKEIKACLPVSRTTEAIISSGNVIFICPGGTREVHAYNIEIDSWSKFPDAPTQDCSLTLIKQNLTVIGGKMDNNQFTNKVMSLIRSGGVKKWVEIYPRMEVKRSNITIANCPTILIVAGGENELGYIQAVEVLDTTRPAKLLAWTRVADLPEPLAMASATICGGDLCILEVGWKNEPLVCRLLCFHHLSPTFSIHRRQPLEDTCQFANEGCLLCVGERSSSSSWWEGHSPTFHCSPHIQPCVGVLGGSVKHVATTTPVFCYCAGQQAGGNGWMDPHQEQLLAETKTIEIADIL